MGSLLVILSHWWQTEWPAFSKTQVLEPLGHISLNLNTKLVNDIFWLPYVLLHHVAIIAPKACHSLLTCTAPLKCWLLWHTSLFRAQVHDNWLLLLRLILYQTNTDFRNIKHLRNLHAANYGWRRLTGWKWFESNSWECFEFIIFSWEEMTRLVVSNLLLLSLLLLFLYYYYYCYYLFVL